jgi:hypothetical protein
VRLSEATVTGHLTIRNTDVRPSANLRIPRPHGRALFFLQLNIAADGSVLTNPQKIPFGQPITEKSEVTERIRVAQRAILSPSTPSDVFLSRADTATELAFSANRIVLNISGPDVTDLNFIDLPGSCFDPLPRVFYILPRTFRWW